MNYKKIIFVISFLAAFGFLFSFNTPTVKAMTITEIQALIQQLQQQIAQLQQQLKVAQEKPEVWCHDFNVNLRIGESGSEVQVLWTVLEKEGLDPGDTHTSFGETMASAVVGFQEKYKSEVLTPLGLKYGTGFVGKATRAKLNALYGCGVLPTPTPTPTPTPSPSITVLSPNGGEQWSGSQQYIITWTSSGNPYSQIDLLIAGYDSSGNQIGDWKLIAAGVSTSQGYYYWVPSGAPLYLPSGFATTPSKYKIKIREANDSVNAITDISNNYFSISY